MADVRDVAARGARIRFASMGEGAPILLVHDVLSSRATWDEVVGPLSEKAHLIAADLPGFGDSEKPPPSKYPYAYDAFAESLVDLAASLELGRITVCGHGLGAAIALFLAARHESIVDRVILVSPTINDPPGGPLARNGTLPVVGSLLLKQAFGPAVFRHHFKRYVYGPNAKIPDARIDELYASFSEPAARAAAHATLACMRDPRPVVARLRSVRVSALVVGGRDDRSFLSQGRRLVREIGGRYEVLDCGRAPHEECPEAFVRSVLGFLEDDATQKRRATKKNRSGRAA
jgi:pimeloyl-ACP methyl ester carboxylesterase